MVLATSLGSLASLSFGQDVAEHDENLDTYFLATSTYWAVVKDQADAVLGAKGTGKSAIARYLSRADIAIPELSDVLLIPAFNLRGSVLFRRLTDSTKPSDESAYRDLFLAYIVGLAGNHLIQTFKGAADVSQLDELMHASGLAVSSNSVHSIWRRALERLKPRIETTITISDEQASERIDRADEVVTLEVLERLLEVIYDFVEKRGIRCWVIFDRLDEAFVENHEIEVTALRGLLRAQIDACSFGNRLRAKLFLRLDIFERITETVGFVNATHLRTTRISWNSDSIHHLVALRLKVWNQRANGTDPSLDLSSPIACRRLCRRILPRKIDRYDSLVWLLLVTVDGTREYNPRNVITLLRNAQLEEIQITTRNAEDIDIKPAVLSHRAMAAGYKQLSVARLNDTLYAESAIARENIPKLRGKVTKFSQQALADKLGIDGAALDHVVQVLIYVGFLRIDGDSYLIPPLYRPALFSSTHKAELVIGAWDLGGVQPNSESEDSEDDGVADLEGQGEGSAQSNDGKSLQGSPEKRRRRRSRTRKNRSGRDEFIPTGARSEVVDEVSFAAEIRAELDIEAGELSETDPEPLSLVTNVPRSIEPQVSKGQAKRQPSGGAQAVLSAREMGEQGDAAGGFRLLYPQYTHHHGAACVAADLAYLSSDADVIAAAREMLLAHSDAWAAQGRSVALAVADGDFIQAQSILKDLRRDHLQTFAIGVIRMVGQAPDKEAAFWRRSLEFDAEQEVFSPMRNKWCILAGSRALSIGRHYWESGTDAGFVGVSGVRDLIWDQASWAASVRHIMGWTWAYARDDASSMPEPSLLPYQVLSCATVLESVGRLSFELRAGVVDRLSRQLAGAEFQHRERFLEWAQYSPMVLELLEDPDRRPRRYPSPVVSVPANVAEPSSVGQEDVELILKALDMQRASGDDTRIILLAILGSRLRRVAKDFDFRARGYATLMAFVTACAQLDTRIKLARNAQGHPYVWLDVQNGETV
jgi:hypothetical protein